MSHKTKQILLIALLSLLITALFAASFTYARYYKETGVTGGKYDDTIEFVGANKYIVYSPEELVSAIENGYSYIEIGEGAEEPFVITDGVTDVSANLVLDINGHDLVRNSRNPLIDVQENVSVVIVYDSKASGSFYNPVGSLLQASGGTLTIATGDFTSGPKAEDYVTDVGTEEDYVKDTGTTEEGVSYSLGNYTVYYRDGYTPGADSPNRSGEYIEDGEVELPYITPKRNEKGEPYGNIYFETGISGNTYIKEDTFLIYTEETVDASEGTTVDFEPLCDVASCDFYYYYVTDTDGSGEDKTTTYAVIYGYHDVMKGAEQQITKTGFNTSGSINNNSAEAVIWPYATVRMTQGEAFIRGGTYTNQFGTAQSYGIYARGGDLAISGGGTSFSAIEDGVCVRCETTIVDGVTYVPQLNISGTPQFSSVNNETVQVEGGDIVVSSGTATVEADNSTGIYIDGGNLEVASTATLDVKAKITESSTGIYHSPDGVLIDGGSLVSKGTLNVTMRNGKQNSYTSNMYDDLVINSFAVRVLNAETVTILNGDITNNVGGGVYVGGGTVTLGTSGDTTGYSEESNTGLTVTTTGTGHENNWYDQNGNSATGNDAWHFHKNTTGGHAVEVVGGNLTIHGGKYSASMGNGIQVNNQESDSVIINGGTFLGADAYTPGTTGSAALAGPGASYAFKMYGGSVTINGGTFGDPNSLGGGAFVTGSGSLAKATILAGTFDVGGTAAFTVYQNAELTFGTQGDTANNELLLKGESAGLTVEKLDGGTASSVTIHSGTFSGGNHEKNEGGCDGIYYNGSGQTRLTITGGDFVGKSDSDKVNYGRSGLYLDVGPAVKNAIQISGGTFTGGYDGLYYGANGNVVHGMVISGGEFIGTNRSGLYFNVNQWVDSDGNVSISGGTFIGIPKEHTEYYAFVGWKTWYTDGAMGAESEEYDEGLGWSIQIFDLVDQGRNVDYYSNNDSVESTQINNGQWTEGDRQTIALNVTGCKYSKVVVR